MAANESRQSQERWAWLIRRCSTGSKPIDIVRLHPAPPARVACLGAVPGAARQRGLLPRPLRAPCQRCAAWPSQRRGFAGLHQSRLCPEPGAAMVGRASGESCWRAASAWASRGCNTMVLGPTASAASRSPPTAITRCPSQRAGLTVHGGRARSGLVGLHHLRRHRRGLAVAGRADRLALAARRWLVAAARHDLKHRHERLAHGLVQASPGQARRLEISQQSGQPVREL